VDPQAASQAVLDAEHAAFIQSGVVIVAASRDLANLPAVAYGIGCLVTPDASRVTILFPASSSAALLADVRATRTIAAAFAQPSTHRTIQVKGFDAEIVSVSEVERAAIPCYVRSIVDELILAGDPEALARAFFIHAPQDIVGVAFTPAAAFRQTPGVGAGSPLGA
jgi:hypothetical protein